VLRVLLTPAKKKRCAGNKCACQIFVILSFGDSQIQAAIAEFWHAMQERPSEKW